MTSQQQVLDFLVTPQMTDDESRVWYELRGREGADAAIQVRDLAKLVGIAPRKVQSVVRSLIHERAKPIGTSMRPPYGYFHAVSSEDRQAVADLHRRRAIAELATAAKILGIDRATYVRRFQTELGAA